MKKKFKSLLMCMLTVCMLFGTTSMVFASNASDGGGVGCRHQFKNAGSRLDKNGNAVTMFRCVKCGYIK